MEEAAAAVVAAAGAAAAAAAWAGPATGKREERGGAWIKGCLFW